MSGCLDIADDDQCVGVCAGRCEAVDFHGRNVVRRPHPQGGRQGTGQLVLELFAELSEAVAVATQQGGVEGMVDDDHGAAVQGRLTGTKTAFIVRFFHVEKGRRQRRRMVGPARDVDGGRVAAVRGRREVLVVPVAVARRLEAVVVVHLPVVTPRRVRNGRRRGDVIGLRRLHFLRLGVGLRAPNPAPGAPQHGIRETREAIQRRRGGVPLRRPGGVLVGRLAALIKSQVVVGLFARLDEEGRDEQPEE